MELFTPFEFLLIDVANKAGKDKAEDGSTHDYQTRLLWAYEHIANFEDMVKQVKNPAQFMKAVLAVRDTENGIPTGHMVNLDSASSGGQLLSTALRCEVGMRNTGVINTGKAPSLYKTLTDIIECDVPLKKAKTALMCYLYGSVKEPEKAFGDQVDMFYQGAEKVAPRACIFRGIAMNAWNPFALAHEWVMPNGNTVFKRVWETVDHKISVPNLDNRSFTFRHKVNQGKEHSVSLSADITHSVDAYFASEMSARCNHDIEHLEYLKTHLDAYLDTYPVGDRTKMISLDKVIELDVTSFPKTDKNYLAQARELIDYVLGHRAFPVMVIHDDYACHSNNVQRMREHYNRLLWELYHSTLVQDILEQITGTRYDQFDYDHDVANAILENDYAIN